VRKGNTAAYPPLRPAPRPVLPAGAERGIFHEPHAPWGYPPARRAEGADPGFTTERYYRFESTGAEVTLADTDATVKVFSGYPDKIVLHVRTGGALVTLTDQLGQETDEVIVHTDMPREVFLPRNVVKARNLVAGTNALLYAEAYYAAPFFSQNAR
jgi:hypothetical protein